MFDNVTIEDIFMFLAIWFGVLIIILVALQILVKKKEAENKSKPIRRTRARIIDMQKFEAGAIVIGEPWVLFELEDGSRIRVNAKQNNCLMIGDSGMLTWQGTKIVKFERENM